MSVIGYNFGIQLSDGWAMTVLASKDTTVLLQGMEANVVGDALSRWIGKLKPDRERSDVKDK